MSSPSGNGTSSSTARVVSDDASERAVAEAAAQRAVTALLGLPSALPSALLAARGVPTGADGQSELSGLLERASQGHSPSARALVNASDLLTSLCLVPTPVAPSAGLREKILACASRKVTATRSVGAVDVTGGVPLAAAHDTLTRMHVELPEDLERRRLIEELGAAGGPGHEREDADIRALLDRLAPFVDFEIVLVSIVRGPETIHRAHRGFPAELGNVDVVPRAVSFCTHCVSADAPLVVHDAAAEAFFRQGVMVRDMGARAYLGVPIRVGRRHLGVDEAPLEGGADKTPLGALCCIGTRPRQTLAADVDLVALFAQEAEAIVAKDAARRADIRAEPFPWLRSTGKHSEPRPIPSSEIVSSQDDQPADASVAVYRESWFKQLLEVELDRFRAASGSRHASVLLVVDASVDRAALSAFVAEPARLVGELPNGCYGILIAGGVRAAPSKANSPEAIPARGVPSESAVSAPSLRELRAALPGARVAGLAVEWSSADAWIAAAR